MYCNHAATSFYATKMADPTGVAIFGEHYRCEECDAEDADDARGYVLEGDGIEVD